MTKGNREFYNNDGFRLFRSARYRGTLEVPGKAGEL
jgi:hypothetical protein